MAKESVVATLTVLTDGINIASIITPLAAAALLVFCLLYTPCVAAITSIKRELGGRWAVGVVICQCVIAWICAFMNIPTVIVLILIAAAVAGAAIHMASNKNSCGSCGGCGSYERCSRCKKLK